MANCYELTKEIVPLLLDQLRSLRASTSSTLEEAKDLPDMTPEGFYAIGALGGMLNSAITSLESLMERIEENERQLGQVPPQG